MISISSWRVGGDQVHILVKPTKPNLATNIVITTSKRTYYLELHSYKDTYMAAVSWRYPREALGLRGVKKMTRQAKSKAAATISKPSLSIDNLNFRYEIKGDTPHWRPLRAFDDGQKVFIQFPARLDQGEAPPLFVMGSPRNGKKRKSQLVNYRVKGSYYIVDRLFKSAELRLAALKQKGQAIDKFLRTPQTPRQQLVPKGQMRAQGLAKARLEVSKQRVDISKEINQIRQRLEKQKQQQKIRDRSR